VHDVDDVGGAANGTEVDDRVVTEAEFLDIPDVEVEVILEAVCIVLANLLRAPFLKEIIMPSILE
jgi:hypothetical protein